MPRVGGPKTGNKFTDTILQQYHAELGKHDSIALDLPGDNLCYVYLPRYLLWRYSDLLPK